ncbi:SDR family NAD(P)-dependent oxidoreductase [Streptomyces griseiscabiei]|uniref:SDR family oxidoreductase n=1 Tax=Streptomyces griseiscabiei TaxID=2993540 RepID=A0ABU4L6M8_9ACTN|nr:SDR family oxidoreductase [Streptomyces griseiscabiei]MBZ3906341.1 SDR family oxidoreductase [Streptomyces griseiscabiei]MDX2911338.1 SDR family oxidoreductase [Streptomyces griseiscabiei]
MDLELTGRVAVVTGGSLGIGRAVARELAREGVNVVITARRQAALEHTAKEIEAETGSRVVPLVSDTTDTESVRAMVASAVAELGRVDILVNGAAAPSGLVRNSVEEADPEMLLADIDTKVVGYFRCAQAVTPHMKANGYGRIVNIGGLTGRSSHALSGMRNLAVVHMTKALSDQLGPSGITVNTVHPGVVETEHIHELYEKEAAKRGITAAEVEADFVARTPIRRVLTAGEIAEAIAFLASPRAAAITGESLGIDGGLTRGVFL